MWKSIPFFPYRTHFPGQQGPLVLECGDPGPDLGSGSRDSRGSSAEEMSRYQWTVTGLSAACHNAAEGMEQGPERGAVCSREFQSRSSRATLPDF